LGYFKTVDKHPFTLSHCCLKLKDFPKWQDIFKAWYKDGKKCPEDSTIYLEDDGSSKNKASKDQPRGHKAKKKADLRRQALSIAMENTLRMVFIKKEEANAKRDERRCREKEEQ
jgi:CRISPR/Cas system CSM-associated protein Csm4 (group 5 of RAMP superfamily)